MFLKIVVLKNFAISQKSFCVRVFFNEVTHLQNCNFGKKKKKGKKEIFTKLKLFKGCHQGQTAAVVVILERPDFKNFSCWSTIVTNNNVPCLVFHCLSTLKFILSALYFTGAFKVVYTRTTSSYSKGVIYFKYLEINCKEVNCKVTTWKFTKKSCHVLLHVFCLHSLRMYQDYFFRRGLQSLPLQFFLGNISEK